MCNGPELHIIGFNLNWDQVTEPGLITVVREKEKIISVNEKGEDEPRRR